MPLVTLLWVNFVRLRGKIKDMHWVVKVKVGRKGAKEEAFLNSLPSKFSLVTTVFYHSEDPFHRKCSWKELDGAIYTQK